VSEIKFQIGDNVVTSTPDEDFYDGWLGVVTEYRPRTAMYIVLVTDGFRDGFFSPEELTLSRPLEKSPEEDI